MGHDWSHATVRTPNYGQTLVNQFLDHGGGDTVWLRTTGPVPSAGTQVTVGDSAPTADRWELAAAEVTPLH